MSVGENHQYQKQQAQYLNMRGAQIAEQTAKQKTELGSRPKATGTKKQLIGTIIGIIAFFVLLILLAALDII